MTTAFVLSGGANLGAAQVGMLKAVDELGVRPDFVVGTSIGALNGAWVAAGAPLDELSELWRSLRRILREGLAFERLEDALIPLHVVVTDVLTGAGMGLYRSHPALRSGWHCTRRR